MAKTVPLTDAQGIICISGDGKSNSAKRGHNLIAWKEGAEETRRYRGAEGDSEGDNVPSLFCVRVGQ